MNFENVSVEVKGNSYFEGAVTSRTIHFSDGSKKTLGFMAEGEYTFGTQAAELMKITSGELDYKLEGESKWSTANSGESFNVPANSKFQVHAKNMVDYCCSYL
ncbi:MAG: Unknown protein [uncultured Sulfurovum sp.]|uniref:Pyrimidine/purine nucleoside phosphorylase n=1 Tax=uncultured Sulfurovum sp. TaxID=269237 RepID=A0A6S6TCM1_9BACT|nr:MAG: Unknown protein [uncultured Sulfurovum sp.]